MDEGSLYFAVIEALAAAMDGDPDTALSLLGAFVVNHLMERLTARQIWDFLREKGISPRTGSHPALSERVRELTDRYVRGVQQARPPRLPLLPRAEVDRVVQALTAPDGPRTVAVTGPPGGGKSTVVASVCERLTGLGVVVGPMRLDVAAEAATAESLGGQEDIGFGGPPGRILGRAAAGELAVLIVDQLDAMSALSGRGEPVLEGVRETLGQARAIPSVRVAVACRSHDLKYDRRLCRLLTGEPATGDNGGSKSFAEVPVGELSPELVHHAVGVLGLPGEIPPPLVTLLGNAFNLSLLADVVSDASARGELADLDLRSFRTRMDLLAEYHRRAERRLQPTLGLNQGQPRRSPRCMPDYSWIQPLQVNAARPEHQGRRAKYGAPVLAAFTLLGSSRAPMPHDAGGAFMKQGSDYSPRLRLLSSRGMPSPGQTVAVTEGEYPPPGRPGHSGCISPIMPTLWLCQLAH
jgi:hypothetical protein